MQYAYTQQYSPIKPKNAYEWRVFLFSHAETPLALNKNNNPRKQEKRNWRR